MRILKVETITMWNAPVVREIAVGLEINCYACADL
jgi:coenzyme PQQ precursor peptide PqqA